MTDELLKTYYDNALIHLAWLSKPNGRGRRATRCLVFGMIEAYPKELTVFPVLKEQMKKYKVGRLYYVRIRRTMEQAIALYRSVMERGIIPYDWSETELNAPVGEPDGEIFCGRPERLVCTRPFPCFTLADQQHINTPFVADCWGKANLHQIMAADPEPLLTELLRHEGPGEWLEQYLGWNLSGYSELIGSVHLVLPNPYYSSCHIRMIPGEGRADRIKLDFQLRGGMDASALRIVPFEKTYFGFSACRETRMESPDCVIELPGRAEEFGMYVRAPELGLIDRKDFSGFFRKLNLEVYVKSATKRTKRPDNGREEEFDLHRRFASLNCAEPEDANGDALGKRLTDAEMRRRRKQEIARQGMHLFYQEHDDAERFVRELIRHARYSVRLIDPYFATTELFAYIAAVSVDDISVEILTSAACLNRKSNLRCYGENNRPRMGDELLRQCENWKRKALGKLAVYVMTGDRPAIHDRFVIVDDKAWFCGGSMNELGNRLSCIVRLPDAEELTDRVEEIKHGDRVLTLEQWSETRPENVEPAGEQSRDEAGKAT